MKTIVLCLFVVGALASQPVSPSEKIASFYQNLIGGGCDAASKALAAQPSGNVYTNVNAPNTMAVVNRTNVVPVCQSYQGAKADSYMLTIDALSKSANLEQENYGAVAFVGTDGFLIGAGEVCNVGFSLTVSGFVDPATGLIAKAYVAFDAAQYARKFHLCTSKLNSKVSAKKLAAAPRLHAALAHGTLLKPEVFKLHSAPSPMEVGLQRFLAAFLRRNCSALKQITAEDFTLLDGNTTMNLTTVMQMCASTATAWDFVPLAVPFLSSPTMVYLSGVINPTFINAGTKGVCSVALAQVFTAEGSASTGILSHVSMVYDVEALLRLLSSRCGISQRRSLLTRS